MLRTFVHQLLTDESGFQLIKSADKKCGAATGVSDKVELFHKIARSLTFQFMKCMNITEECVLFQLSVGGLNGRTLNSGIFNLFLKRVLFLQYT